MQPLYKRASFFNFQRALFAYSCNVHVIINNFVRTTNNIYLTFTRNVFPAFFKTFSFVQLALFSDYESFCKTKTL